MKDYKVKNNYLISCVFCILILMTICYFGMDFFVKGTFAGFGGITGCMGANIDLVYHPNYPDDFENPEIVTKKVCSSYIVLDNMYDVPLGYEFKGWNTNIDGTGKMYYANSIIILSDNITLYAQWNKKSISYGDLNKDSNINDDDYVLLENYLNGLGVLEDEILLSADVNGDYKVDEIDLDILKQVNLGTLGYVGYLPNEIVPIYEIYVQKETNEENNNDSNDDDKQDTVMGSGGNGHTSGNGTGLGGTGNGNSSTGNAGNSVKPNTGTNKPNNNYSNNNIDNNINEDKNEKIESRTYKFKFFVDDIEYDNTSCTTKNSNNCKLVLPKIEPSKKGYKFNGWNVDKTCPNNVGINYSILLEDDATYYACFLEVEEKNIYGIIFSGFLIVIVWILSIFGIITLINRFKKTSIED